MSRSKEASPFNFSAESAFEKHMLRFQGTAGLVTAFRDVSGDGYTPAPRTRREMAQDMLNTDPHWNHNGTSPLEALHAADRAVARLIVTGWCT